MKRTVTIEVDQTVADALDEMQDEIKKLRATIVSLAVFIGGEPCWCRYAKTGEHTEACRAVLKLRLWPRPSKGVPVDSDFMPWK